jgi:cation transport regulator
LIRGLLAGDAERHLAAGAFAAARAAATHHTQAVDPRAYYFGLRRTTSGVRSPVMPARENSDLAPVIRRHPPPHAQDVYREAFNHVFAANAADPGQIEAAPRIAWSGVKRRYVEVGGEWVARRRPRFVRL